MTIRAGALVNANDFTPRRCKISATTTQSITSGVTTQMLFGATDYDTEGMADLANDQIVIKTAGWYTVTAKLSWNSSSTGYRIHLIDYTGGHLMQDYRAPTTGTSTGLIVTSEPFEFAVNDAIWVNVLQNTGAALNLGAINSIYGSLAVHWHSAS